MKIKKIILCLLLISASLLTSCTSVYQTPEDTTDPPVSDSKEYFTDGTVYKKGDFNSGFLYKDYWIYCERITTRVEHRYSDGSINGETGEVSRIAKVNAKTGTVSSICLDPACNHSLFSSCPLLCFTPDILTIQGVVGDWLMFSFNRYEAVTEMYTESYIYNMQTGELVEIFEYDIDGAELIKYNSRCVFEDKLYTVKNDLDYSQTKYDPADDKPLSEYTPETVSTLCEFDFKDKKSRDLFEIPEGYAVAAVSNKRFFFQSPEGDIYSCDKSGKNFVKEDVLDFSPQHMCGQYAYNILQNSVEVYDLDTNKINVISHDLYPEGIAITDQGILMSHLTTYEEYLAFYNQKAQFIAERKDTMPMIEITDLLTVELNKIVYKGKAQTWLFSPDGSSREVIYELNGGRMNVFYAIDGYLYCFLSTIDPNTYDIISPDNDGRCFVNIETGEITPIPFLEIESTLYVFEE